MYTCNDINLYSDIPSQMCLMYLENRYKLIKSIGEGAFSIVLSLIDKESNEQIALKVTGPNQMELRVSCAVSGLVQQRLTLSFLTLRGWFICGPPKNTAWTQIKPESGIDIWEESSLMYLDMEKADLSLYDIMRDGGEIDMKDFLCISFEIIYALIVGKTKYKLVHGDIQLSNILIKYVKQSQPRIYDINGVLYVADSIYLPLISDFGTSTIMKEVEYDPDINGVVSTMELLYVYVKNKSLKLQNMYGLSLQEIIISDLFDPLVRQNITSGIFIQSL